MEDIEIVEMYWDRNKQAISETAAKYGPMCFKISMNILENREDAEENVNDTYMTAWNVIPPERPSLLGAFVAKIVRNLSLKRLEFNTAQKRMPEAVVAFEELSEYLSGDKGIEQTFDSMELAESISQFLKEQSYEARLIFLRKYWFMDSNKEIAERYKVSVGSINASLFRTRKKLKKHLQEEGFLE